MISTQYTIISGSVVQLDCCSVHFLEFVFRDTDVVVFKNIMPCLVKLRTWFAPKLIETVEFAIVRYLVISYSF